MNGPENNSMRAIAHFIQEALDPGANLRHTDDAADVVAGLDRVFADEGGAAISVWQMQRYLDILDSHGVARY